RARGAAAPRAQPQRPRVGSDPHRARHRLFVRRALRQGRSARGERIASFTLGLRSLSLILPRFAIALGCAASALPVVRKRFPGAFPAVEPRTAQGFALCHGRTIPPPRPSKKQKDLTRWLPRLLPAIPGVPTRPTFVSVT